MAKPKKAIESLPKKFDETRPELKWLRCINDGMIPFYEATREFPFRSVHELGESWKNAEVYLEVIQEKILYEPFMQTMCESPYAYIIQKSFEISHLKSIISFIQKLRKEIGKLSLSEILVVTDRFSAPGLSCVKTGGMFTLKIKSSLFVGHGQTSEEKSFRSFHDRIVLLKNGVWHFGADVCGMHSSPYAFSGPWPDPDNRLKTFIEKLAD